MSCFWRTLKMDTFSFLLLFPLAAAFRFDEDYFLQPYDAGQLKDSMNFSCLQWTPWISADFPTGEGDWETISPPGDKGNPGTIDGYIPHIQVCNTPVTIQCRNRIDNTSWTNIYDELAVPCTTRLGLICRTQDQAYGRLCHDYEIRFLCWKDCPQLEWSNWLDFDDPEGSGDLEVLGETIPRDRWPCLGGEIPIDAQCETLTGIPASQSKKKGLQCSNLGFSCLNALQGPNCHCSDYRVRFLCPVKLSYASSYKRARMFTKDY